MFWMHIFIHVLLQLPLDPLITWTLSPALIRACTSVELLAPGITISVKRKWVIHFASETNFKSFDICHHTLCYFKIVHFTCCGDNSLHVDSGFLQKVDRQAASRAGASHAHANLARHHWDWSWLDGPDTCYRLVIQTRHGTPANMRSVMSIF